MHYKNFKCATYCVASWVNRVTKEELESDLEFFSRYAPIDKVYLEAYRGEFAQKEQILMVKNFLEEKGIEVSGGITTVTEDLSESDKKRRRLFGTFCYSNGPMRKKLSEISEYAASLFDEFIIDDFFFTQCMCEDCIKEKGEKSWSEFRLQKMLEVSKSLVLDPAKKTNPNCKVIIKYPNWRESYHETGYNLFAQKDLFDKIYTGTETRHGSQQDQHLPRYLSYSLMRYMENAAPGKNGGGWFDPFECDRIDAYLEQAYLTALSKPKEIMLFCWSALSNNRRLTPLGFQLGRLDAALSSFGNPVGVPVYIPFNSFGEDHVEDYLGMIGVPFEPTPEYPKNAKTIFLTEASAFDPKIVSKIEASLLGGAKVIATSGFLIFALEKFPEIKKFTSATWEKKFLEADEFQVTVSGLYGRSYIKSKEKISFPLICHRNNSTWSKMNAGSGNYHESVLMFDTYGEGTFEILCLPNLPSKIKEIPSTALSEIRAEFFEEICVEGANGISLFAYDNDALALYCYTEDGCSPADFRLKVKGAKSLVPIFDGTKKWPEKAVLPLYADSEKSVFPLRMIPGEWAFYKIER